ncbi:OB-fold domain-containing protein [Planotetraspora sp. A-T 1434]|uniref:Zn-ribbon domain-containing OB-fold protein n=1 Tax=Planotetraspora sp. A-T 1434 TaxID=2979219 RepID=UPI0021C113EC|nr:OB-fold domain-containing protein [Planotetraspora sp. A-T 1434]MCT9929014.1 OB-fold domain-containing protein [Planotetraspora sp. A-T 1434]
MTIDPVARDTASADFFDGTRGGLFLLRRRRSTGEYLDPRSLPLPGDEADWEYVAARGGGRVVSWATVHSRKEDRPEAVRTVVGIVELDEGPWWWCRLDDVDPDADLADLRVQVEVVPSGPAPEDEMVPVFRPARLEHAESRSAR